MTLKGVTNQLQIFIIHVASVPEFIFLFYVQYVFVIGREPDHVRLRQNSTPGSDCPVIAFCDYIKPQPLQLIRPFCHLGFSLSFFFSCCLVPQAYSPAESSVNTQTHKDTHPRSLKKVISHWPSHQYWSEKSGRSAARSNQTNKICLREAWSQYVHWQPLIIVSREK